jgi:hypothetical protein
MQEFTCFHLHRVRHGNGTFELWISGIGIVGFGIRTRWRIDEREGDDLIEALAPRVVDDAADGEAEVILRCRMQLGPFDLGDRASRHGVEGEVGTLLDLGDRKETAFRAEEDGAGDQRLRRSRRGAKGGEFVLTVGAVHFFIGEIG